MTLAELGVAKADLVEAGLIRNPVFSILFPLGPKQLEFTLTWPIEALWQRPRRVAAAQLDVARAAERLVQGGLDLVRDVRLRPESAALHGVSPGDVRRAVATLVRGTKVGEIYEGQKVFDVAVWGEEHLRTDIASLRDLRIDTRSGGQVPLGAVADVFIAPAPNVVVRENASRRIDVTCNVRGGPRPHRA